MTKRRLSRKKVNVERRRRAAQKRMGLLMKRFYLAPMMSEVLSPTRIAGKSIFVYFPSSGLPTVSPASASGRSRP